MDTDRKLGRLQWKIGGPNSSLANPWCGASAHTGCRPWVLALERRMVHVNGRICFGSATPTCMGDHESLEAGGVLVEEELKWKWLR